MTLSRQKLTLIGIFAIFMGPVILVMLMRSSWWDYQPAGMKNHGNLLQPPVPIELEARPEIERKWLILYALPTDCDTSCLDEVTALRQIHKAAGRRAENLEVVLLSRAEPATELQTQLESIYPMFVILPDREGAAFGALNTINMSMMASDDGFGQVRTYVADPNRNIILAYRVDADPNDLHKDLKRLLKWSEQES